MYKLVLFFMMTVFYMMLFALQTDEEIAMNTLFQAKHSLNRAVHAAAQQIDEDKIAQGVYSIESIRAETKALSYLQENLKLDTSNMPIAGSFLDSKVGVLEFEVINEDHTFPFNYSNNAYEYSVTLKRPGVVMIIKVIDPEFTG